MAVPSSGELSLTKVANEKNQNDYNTDDNEAETFGSISLRGLSNNSFDDFGTGAGATNNTVNVNGWADTNNTSGQTGANIANSPYAISEFYGYNHDQPAAFAWGTPGTTPSSAFDFEAQDQTNGSFIKAAATVRLVHSSNTVSWTVVEDSDGPSETGMGTTASRSVTYSGGSLTNLQVRVVFYNGVDVVENNSYSNPDTSIKVRARYSNNSHLTHTSDDTAASAVVDFSPQTGYNFTDNWYNMSTSGDSSAQLQLLSGSTSNSLVDKEARLHNGNVRIQLRANNSDSHIITLVDQAIDIYAHTAKAGS